MATSSINAKLTLDPSQHDAALASSQGKVNSYAAGMSGIAGKLAAAFSVGAAAHFSKQIIAELSMIADKASNLRIATDEMQAIEYAGYDTGNSLEDVNNALSRILATSSDISSNAKIQKAFQGIGMSIEDVLRSNPAAIFERMGVALNTTTNRAQTLSDIFEIIGKRSGPQFIALLENVGNSKLDGLINSARDAGAIIDRSLITAADSMDATIQRMIKSIKGVILLALSPIPIPQEWKPSAANPADENTTEKRINETMSRYKAAQDKWEQFTKDQGLSGSLGGGEKFRDAVSQGPGKALADELLEAKSALEKEQQKDLVTYRQWRAMERAFNEDRKSRISPAQKDNDSEVKAESLRLDKEIADQQQKNADARVAKEEKLLRLTEERQRIENQIASESATNPILARQKQLDIEKRLNPEIQKLEDERLKEQSKAAEKYAEDTVKADEESRKEEADRLAAIDRAIVRQKQAERDAEAGRQDIIDKATPPALVTDSLAQVGGFFSGGTRSAEISMAQKQVNILEEIREYNRQIAEKQPYSVLSN